VPDADITFTIATPKLAFTMHTTLSEPSVDVPYLAADPYLVSAWHEKLASLPGPKIGISWCSTPMINLRTREKLLSPRSIPLALFKPLITQFHGTFISLQCGYGVEQLAETRLPLICIPDIDTMHGPFMDTIAIMKNLDLIITIDTSIAHIAGALGVSVWTLLPACSDFRWFTDRSDSPWYPTMRLFRQKSGENWEIIISEVLLALQHEVWHA
jgi:hypothetical protein